MTATDLAKSLTLSRTTVSLVLNGRGQEFGISARTIERVVKGANLARYRPDPIARQLAGMRSNIVGVLVNTSCSSDPRLIERMEVLAFERQLRFIVGHAMGGSEQIREYIRDFRARRVDAVVSFHHNNSEFQDAIYAELSHVQRVLYYDRPDGDYVIAPLSVGPDYFQMGKIAAEHLIRRGCRKIGLIGLEESIYPILRRRREGFEQALADAGRSPPEVWHVNGSRSIRWIEPHTDLEAAEIINELVIRRGVDGLFAINDLHAARLISVLRRLGRRVPDDVAIIGADNMDIGTLVDPQITTVDLQLDELTSSIMRLLFEMLSNESPTPTVSILVPPILIRRESA